MPRVIVRMMDSGALGSDERTSADAVVELDLRTERWFLGHRFWRLVGRSGGEARPTTEALLARVHPEDASALRRAIDALETGARAAVDLVCRFSGDAADYVPLRFSIEGVNPDADGRSERILGVAAALPGRLAPTPEPGLPEARLRGLSERINEDEFVLSTNGLIVEANDRAVALYGYDHTTLVSMHIRALRAPETLARMDAQLATAAAIGANMGAKIKMALMMSMKHPTMSNMMLTRTRKPVRDRSCSFSHSTMASGICSSTRK